MTDAPRGLPRLVAFDLDGTLVDSLHDLTDSANQLLDEHGAAPLSREAVGRMVGDGVRRLVERVIDAGGVVPWPPDGLDRFLQIYDQRLLVHTRPYPGIPEVLERLSRVCRLALVTNKPRAAAVRVLEELGLAAYFVEAVYGDGPEPRKPRPAGLLAVIARAAAGPVGTLFVGDSQVDLETARAAGVPFCLARYGFGVSRLAHDALGDHDLAIDHPVDLLAALGDLPASM